MQEFLPNTFPGGSGESLSGVSRGFAYLTSNGNSTREAGQFQLRRRLHNGFTATLQYTYSKSIDDAALGGRGQGRLRDRAELARSQRRARPFDFRSAPSLERADAVHHRHGIGGGTLLSGWKGALFKEWTFATQITAGSGLPLTPDLSRGGAGHRSHGSIRPDYTGAPLYAAPAGLFLNPAAYTAPAAGQWGNAGRNSITGPAQFTLNASMAPHLPLEGSL